MTAMKWHAEIAHAAQHPDGWESLECQAMSVDFWWPGHGDRNPVVCSHLQWRIKPDKIRINVEIPKPDGDPRTNVACYCITPIIPAWWNKKADRDEAERILVAALKGEQ